MNQKSLEHYLKIVEWSEEDQCYVGSAPGLMLGGVHGKKEAQVFKDLCKAVDRVIAVLKKEGRPLPKPTIDKKYSGKIALKVPPEIHKALALKAYQLGQSVDKFILNKLGKTFLFQ